MVWAAIDLYMPERSNMENKELSPDWSITIGEVIGEFMEHQGWNQTRLAESTDIQYDRLTDILEAGAIPNCEEAEELESSLDLTPGFVGRLANTIKRMPAV